MMLSDDGCGLKQQTLKDAPASRGIALLKGLLADRGLHQPLFDQAGHRLNGVAGYDGQRAARQRMGGAGAGRRACRRKYTAPAGNGGASACATTSADWRSSSLFSTTSARDMAGNSVSSWERKPSARCRCPSMESEPADNGHFSLPPAQIPHHLGGGTATAGIIASDVAQPPGGDVVVERDDRQAVLRESVEAADHIGVADGGQDQAVHLPPSPSAPEHPAARRANSP